jgi:hypothetical protein
MCWSLNLKLQFNLKQFETESKSEDGIAREKDEKVTLGVNDMAMK